MKLSFRIYTFYQFVLFLGWLLGFNYFSLENLSQQTMQFSLNPKILTKISHFINTICAIYLFLQLYSCYFTTKVSTSVSKNGLNVSLHNMRVNRDQWVFCQTLRTSEEHTQTLINFHCFTQCLHKHGNIRESSVAHASRIISKHHSWSEARFLVCFCLSYWECCQGVWLPWLR